MRRAHKQVFTRPERVASPGPAPSRIVWTMAGQPAAAPGPSRRLVVVMALATAVAVANLYYSQPLLSAMAATLHLPPAPLGIVTTLAQVGYALGLLLLTPLGDVYERRRLVVALLLAVALPLLGMALGGDLASLAGASLLLGMLTVTPQVVVPLAATLAPAERRGRIVGTVMSGLLIGVLLARTVSGVLAGLLGWRTVFALAALATLGLAALLHRELPREAPRPHLPYGQLLRSLGELAGTQAGLREAAATGAALFGAFSAFWTTVTFHLAGAPWHLGPARIGLLGLAGLAGASAAPLAGRLADRRGPRRMVGLALATAVAALALLALFPRQLWAVAVGAAVLDLGVQSGQISNQTRIYALLPGSQSRVNTVYMVGYFLGGSLGSGLGAFAWHLAGWGGALAAGGLLLACGAAVHLGTRPRPAAAR